MLQEFSPCTFREVFRFYTTTNGACLNSYQPQRRFDKVYSDLWCPWGSYWQL